MKKYKDDIKTIIEVLAFVLIFTSIATINNPLISYFCLGLWIILWTFNLYSKIQYRKGKVDYILFSTQNDQYSKTTSITLGLLILVLSIVGIIWTKALNHYAIIGIIIGLLVFFNGIFDLPKGRIKIEGNTISISGLTTTIDQRQLKEIKISTERIILTNINAEIQRVDNLDIDPESAKLIDRYISGNKSNIDLSIINTVC
jgi:hypothetical protein